MSFERVELTGATARERIVALRARGICYQCYNLRTGGAVFGPQHVIHEDERVCIVLEVAPRMRGHTIVVYKPHHEDLRSLSDAETARFFAACVRCANAITRALGAEKVYLNTMCDGESNHLHAQLFPRYPGDPQGSKRFVAPRGTLTDGADTAARIRAAFLAMNTFPLDGTD